MLRHELDVAQVTMAMLHHDGDELPSYIITEKLLIS